MHYHDDAWIYLTVELESKAQYRGGVFLRAWHRMGLERADGRMVYAYRKGISAKPYMPKKNDHHEI